jgi:hypothetical protein
MVSIHVPEKFVPAFDLPHEAWICNFNQTHVWHLTYNIQAQFRFGQTSHENKKLTYGERNLCLEIANAQPNIQ